MMVAQIVSLLKINWSADTEYSNRTKSPEKGDSPQESETQTDI